MSEDVHYGLENVLVAETEICYIDGDRGEVGFRGYPVQQLGRKATFEEVLYLLWHGGLPTRGEYERFTDEMAAQRKLPDEVRTYLQNLASREETPMAALRTAISSLSAYEAKSEADGLADRLMSGQSITSKIPTIIAAFVRLRNGEEPVKPREDLSNPANFFYMLHGAEPDPAVVEALDTALILQAEHGVNASTLNARTTASTLADVYSAITGAIGTLSGGRHGGANQKVMEMLLEIDEYGEDPAEWVELAIAEGKRIPGFGHRVYQVKDRRVELLSEHSERLAETTGETRWHEYCVEIEEFMADAKGLAANIDLYTASMYYQMDMPVDIYTPIFAMSRVGGWVAHLLEQYKDNRLIRPRSRYTGSRAAEFVPIEHR